MAASIIRLEQENSELKAEVALLTEQARIITAERDEARIQYRSTEALGMALVKTIGEMKSERVDLKAKIEALRDQLCADKCRDKSQADGGWGNI
jgi:cell division protein FtsB